jgi:Cft2 family RNA processing exonuclease
MSDALIATQSRADHIGGGPKTTYRRSITYLTLPETAVCSPTDKTR